MDERELKHHTDVLNDLRRRIDEYLPGLVKARRSFFRTRLDPEREMLDRIESELAVLQREFDSALQAFEDASGIDPATLDEYEKARSRNYQQDLSRASLVDACVPMTNSVDNDIAHAVGALTALVPRGWLDAESRDASRLHFLNEDDFLSLTKGLRLQSEVPSIHRFRQMLFVADDFRISATGYDHFAGASIVPIVAHLGNRLNLFDQVAGADARLRRLWEGPSDEVDGTIFELLTAQACVERGRSVEFIDETSEPSPDMRCHDPVPLVIECKRQRSISNYERDEDMVMRDLFEHLRVEARKKGCFGTYRLTLTVDAADINVNAIVDALLAQRFAVQPERSTNYDWGATSYTQCSSYVVLDRATRLYSPYLIKALFGWEPDLPEWDGICCWYANGDEQIVGEVRTPIGLLWRNVSPVAIQRRTWAPVHLFGAAASQVPPGEFAIVYLAYTEGARETIADLRLGAFQSRIKTWAHSAEIRLPISFLNRLYPRTLDDGRPDLIESTVSMISEAYGEAALLEDFPAAVFTVPPSK